MTLVERVGEGLARRLNRRQTLKRAAVAVFGSVAAWTVEGFRGNSALADHCGIVTEGDCTCNPPEGLYCNGLDPSFCAASQCAGGGDYAASYRDAGGGWCRALCADSGGEFGYYPYNAARAIVLERDLPCRPCARDGGPECPLQHHFCMREISPEVVFAALARALA